MVGDSLEADIAPAVALGMHAVWVDELDGGLPSGTAVTPHRTVRVISELIEGSRIATERS
jgi:FMN phosphatase YigB (HAD superfamily)